MSKEDHSGLDEAAYFARTNGPVSPRRIGEATRGPSPDAQINAAIYGAGHAEFAQALMNEMLAEQTANPDRFVIKLGELGGRRGRGKKGKK